MTTDTFGVAAGVAGAAVGATATIGVATCATAAALVSTVVEQHCGEEQARPEDGEPPSIGIVLETRQATTPNEDPCSAVGGSAYSGGPIVLGNDCSDVEGDGGSRSQITLASTRLPILK